MKYPMHLILDTYSHPGISLFWKRHGLRIMEQLVPNEFLFTTGDIPLEKLFEREIWPGLKKIILIGTPNSIRRGFNTLMLASNECRGSLEIGFWPLETYNLATFILQPSSYLKPVLQVFKAGHSIPVDVMKVDFLAPKLETRYFWNDFQIKSTLHEADTSIFIDSQNSKLAGKFNCRVAFHDQTLSSLTMHPGKLYITPTLKVYLKRTENEGIRERVKNITRSVSLEKKKNKEDLLKTGKHIEVQGNWANLTINVPALQDPVQSIYLTVERKAFSLIIPAKPIQSMESISNVIPSFRPHGIIANNRGTTKKV